MIPEFDLEKIMEIWKFAEFGRLSAGMVHDILSSLTAVSLSIEELSKETMGMTKTARSEIRSAVSSVRRMEEFILAIRKQLGKEENKRKFCAASEIESVFKFLGYKARQSGVRLRFLDMDRVMLFGDPLKFHQVISCIVSNAIDAYEGRKKGKNVEVSACRRKKNVFIDIVDHGMGIPNKNLDIIFQPFFTTKDLSHGSGIGLSTAKYLIEEYFKGDIGVKSALGRGTVFTIRIPAES